MFASFVVFLLLFLNTQSHVTQTGLQVNTAVDDSEAPGPLASSSLELDDTSVTMCGQC